MNGRSMIVWPMTGVLLSQDFSMASKELAAPPVQTFVVSSTPALYFTSSRPRGGDHGLGIAEIDEVLFLVFL